MTRLKKDLEGALMGESLANRKYRSFARKADHEGHMRAARLFRAAEEAQAIHAKNHLRALGVVRGTRENLQAALDESHDFERMYPAMFDHAKAENDSWAAKSFCYAFEAGKLFAALFKRALEELGKGGDVSYHVCKVCGFTVEDELPEKCPVCGARKETFKKIA